jgi:hypothetical protein
MTLNKKNLFFSNWLFLVLLVSFIYAVAMGYGLYGFGNDYYAVYSSGNLVNFYNLSDRLGYIISTLTIFNIYLGVYISSFLLAFSLGTLLSAFFKFLQLYSLINFLLIFIIFLHTWPIYLSTSNAMRQGILMSILFLLFSFFFEKKKNYFFFMILFSISFFIHKSSLFFNFIFIAIFIIKPIIIKIKKNQIRLLLFLFAFFLFILFGTVIDFFLSFDQLIHFSRIIGNDNRFLFLLLNICYIIIFTIRYQFLLSSNINLYLYIFSFLVIPILLKGLNWEYERLIMMMLIPYFLSIGTLFKKEQIFFLWFSLASVILFFTYYLGIFKSFN